MLLLKDSLVELYYDVTADVLSMKWPDLTGLTKSEIQHSLQKVIDTLKHYDIKKFLVDARENKVEVPEEVHKQVAYQFSIDLKSTRVEKMARIASTNLEREKRTYLVRQAINQELTFNLEYQEFNDGEAALSWLQKN